MKFLNLVIACGVGVLMSACVGTLQDVFQDSPNYTIRYSHIQNDSLFFEEVKEIASFLPKKESFSGALNSLQELGDSYKSAPIPDMAITFQCAFQKQHTTTLSALLATRKYPCDNEQAGYTLQTKSKQPYKEYYGQKFADTQNKEQFLLRYMKDLQGMQTSESVRERANAILANLDSNENALYELRELKHYAVASGIMPSYQDFYAILPQYEVRCRGSVVTTTLPKALGHYANSCKQLKFVQPKSAGAR